MNECSIAAAWVGIVGVVVGGVISLVVTYLQHHLANARSNELDEGRKRLLKTMLADKQYEWRNLDTLSHVIGADEDTTKRLLLEVGARASEDGQPIWALLSRKPLPTRA